jgi:hypothetical protein
MNPRELIARLNVPAVRTTWTGIARFKAHKNCKPRESRTIELAPGDVVLRDAKRVYVTAKRGNGK